MIRLEETIKRSKCCVCGEHALADVYAIHDAPIYMGVAGDGYDDTCSDMRFVKCERCNTVQIGDLIPLHLLYQANHNIESVGRTWQNHYDAFARFIEKNCDTRAVIELGDPSAKVAIRCKHESWTIIEPNPAEQELPPTIKYKKGYLSSDSGSDYTAAILSHVLEHAFEPIDMLKSLRDTLCENGRICLSIPNMEYLSKTPNMPPLGMHFEHTLFIDLERLKHLVTRAGFRVIDLEHYANHSIFLCASKENPPAPNDCPTFNDVEESFRLSMDYYHKAILSIRDVTSFSTRPIFIYGAHIQTQILICLGLDVSNVIGILDGATSKHGRRLYGTGLTVYSPQTLAPYDSPLVICHMGPYTEEIKESLLKINGNCEFI